MKKILIIGLIGFAAAVLSGAEAVGSKKLSGFSFTLESEKAAAQQVDTSKMSAEELKKYNQDQKEKEKREKQAAAQKERRNKAREELIEKLTASGKSIDELNLIPYIDDVPDGIYRGSAKGYADAIEIALMMRNGQITQIKVLYENESEPLDAFRKTTREVLKNNTTYLDSVAGATETSQAFRAAIDDAIKKKEWLEEWPKIDSKEVKKRKNETAERKKNEAANAVVLAKAKEEREARRAELLKQRNDLLAKKGDKADTTDIDAELGITYYEDKIDGWYIGEATSYGEGKTKVGVRIKDGLIKDIRLVRSDDPKPKGCFNRLRTQIMKTNQTQYIDMVTGATDSSKGFVEAVNNALKNNTMQKDAPKKEK